MEIDGKKYKLEEAYVIGEDEVETQYDWEYGDEDSYIVDVTQKEIKVQKAYVLVKVTDGE